MATSRTLKVKVLKRAVVIDINIDQVISTIPTTTVSACRCQNDNNV